MTLDEAIEALERVRLEVGGEAPLLMVDGLYVVEFAIGDGRVYVCDLPQPTPPEMAFETDLAPLAGDRSGDGQDGELCFRLNAPPTRPLLVRSVTVCQDGKAVLQADLAKPFLMPAGACGLWHYAPADRSLGYLSSEEGRPHRYDPTTGRVRPVDHTCEGLVRFYADGGREVFADYRAAPQQ